MPNLNEFLVLCCGLASIAVRFTGVHSAILIRFPLVAALVAGISTSNVYETQFDGVVWNNENWRLTTTKLDQGHYQSRMSLANGYLGINLAAIGPFFEADIPVDGDIINGWPLFQRRQTFATVSGFWDVQAHTNGSNFPWMDQYGGESVISGVPHWAGLIVKSNGSVLNASVPANQISGFSSTLDIGEGVMTWNYTWSPENAPAVDVEYTMFVHKLHVNRAAVQLKLTPVRDMEVTVMDVFDGDCAVRTQSAEKGFEKNGTTMWSAVQPHWIPYVTAYIYSTLTGDSSVDMSTLEQTVDDPILETNKSSIMQSITVSLTAGCTSVITKYIGGASTDAFYDPQAAAKAASIEGARSGFTREMSSHVKEWSTILTHDSVDNFSMPNGTLPDDMNILKLQITAVTNPFYILQNTIGPNAIKAAGDNDKLNINSISVGGLGSDSYAGLVFWDADVWMHPGLVVSHPEHISAITDYRVAMHKQAQANLQYAVGSSKNQTGRYSHGGAVYPWTSGRFGNCTGTGPCFDYEYHLNGDIGLALINEFFVTGHKDDFEKTRFSLLDDIAWFYSQTLSCNNTTGNYSLTNATDPDEYANHVDRPGFTMALIKTHLENANKFHQMLNLSNQSHWEMQASRIDISIDKDADIVLEYDTMNGSISIKQADVVLIHDFLDILREYSLSDLDYYTGRQSANGPGMTYSTFSVVANDVFPSGCSSYTYDIMGSDPYIRAPWFQYSEQMLDNYEMNGGTHPAYPFLTGMGGANRVAIYGYLGLRLDLDSFNIDPSLPPQIPNLTYRTVYWQGHAIQASSNQTHTTVKRIHRAISGANPEYSHKPIPVTVGKKSQVNHALNFSTPVVIENRRISEVKTWTNNIAQCRLATSPQDFTKGQFPLAAVDGDVATKWQPNVTASQVALMTVSLPGPPFVQISEFRFNWAQDPPVSFSVLFHNSSQVPDPKSFPLSPHRLSEYGLFNVTSQAYVAVSDPYDPKYASDIIPYHGNTTNVTLSKPVWSSNFVTLVISGSHSQKEDGASSAATVAEFGIIEYDGHQLI